MSWGLEHPDITAVLLTGYPLGFDNEDDGDFCEECGLDLSDEDVYEDHDHKCLCERCLLSLHKKGW